jgi:hypothetical protein
MSEHERMSAKKRRTLIALALLLIVGIGFMAALLAFPE